MLKYVNFLDLLPAPNTSFRHLSDQKFFVWIKKNDKKWFFFKIDFWNFIIFWHISLSTISHVVKCHKKALLAFLSPSALDKGLKKTADGLARKVALAANRGWVSCLHSCSTPRSIFQEISFFWVWVWFWTFGVKLLRVKLCQQWQKYKKKKKYR